MVTALIFAHDRWGSTSGPVDYEAGAVELLNVMRHKEERERRHRRRRHEHVRRDDRASVRPFPPLAAARSIGRPSIVMPAYYDLWAQATGDPFWTRAAAARATTGSGRASDDRSDARCARPSTASRVPDWDNFLPESYRAQINMALDQIWTKGGERLGGRGGQPPARFFTAKGIDDYGASFTLDGTAIDPTARQRAGRGATASPR